MFDDVPRISPIANAFYVQKLCNKSRIKDEQRVFDENSLKLTNHYYSQTIKPNLLLCVHNRGAVKCWDGT